MPLPPSLPVIQVTGAFPLIDGETQDGYVTFDPGAVLRYPNGEVVFDGAATAQISASEMIPVTLPCTDTANLNGGQPWVYTVTVHLGSRPYSFTAGLPSTLGTSVDLSELIPSSPPPPASSYGTANTWTATQTFAGNPPFVFPSGAVAGYVLTCDAAGDATWGAFAGAGIADLDGGSATGGVFPVGSLDGGNA